MRLIRSLTVRQSMILVFLSGFATALLFAGSVILGDIRDSRAHGAEAGIIALDDALSRVSRAMLLERGASTAWLAFGGADWADAVGQARVATDRAFRDAEMRTADGRLLAQAGLATVSLGSWRQAQGSLRNRIDGGTTDLAALYEVMARDNAAVLAAMTSATDRSRSAALAQRLHASINLSRAMNALGEWRDRGVIARASAMAAGRPDQNQIADMAAARGRFDGLLAGFRQVAGRGLGEIELTFGAWTQLGSAAAPSGLDTWVADPSERAEGVGVPTWFADVDTRIGMLGTARRAYLDHLGQLIRQDAAAAMASARSKALLLSGMALLFGGVAIISVRSTDQSLQKIVRSICHLSLGATDAPIPHCPQKDLDKVGRALELLRASQVARDRELAANEDLRGRFDATMQRMLSGAANGRSAERLDVLGMDAPTAVLARGINQLLDRVEDKRDTA
ncbi:nitrate- and nitrite sensing domain-containing protein [uncultured Jannaschia sp.]|uniref:nitrate- and nitrite sensing domain-containing protein n=1 Tax=uncultured Jannaschia sp. TaxID=293347 RepID=UPI0026335ED3|nr:nitrate- and nitrite sensing domain-containing protein [uncultured Jannaschia sp.]